MGISLLTMSVQGCVSNIDLERSELTDRFQLVLDDQRSANNIPGISAAVITPDGWIWRGVSGISSETEAMKPEMLFGLGSVSKIYVAALILQLAEEGLLTTSDRVGEWFPNIQHIDENITIRQLLNHTSGIYRYQIKPEYLLAVDAEPGKVWTPQEIIRTFQGESECEPETCWGESAMDYVLLGMIIEKATNSAVSTELRERFFTPLNLDQTYLYPEERYSLDKLAHMWWDVNGSGEPIDVVAEAKGIPMAGLFSSLWTAGGMHATAEDLARWTKALFEGRVLEENSLAEMLSQGPALDFGAYYGYSVIVDEIHDRTFYWHTGGAGYSSAYGYIQEDGVVIAVLSNLMVDPQPITVKLYEAYLTHQE